MQYPNSQFNKSWFQSHFQSYQSCFIHKFFRRKKIIFYCQIMVLNFTRNANSLILMSYYIYCRGTRFRVRIYLRIYNKTISLRCYVVMYPRGDAELSSSNPIFNFFYKFKKKKQNLEKFWKQIFKIKLVSSSLRTAVVKLVYSATRFV